MNKIEQLRSRKGKFTKLAFKSNPKPAAASKGRNLEKLTTGTFRVGLDYSNLGAVKESIHAGERGEVQQLPWGEWAEFPILIKHKDKHYARLYPVHKRDESGKLIPSPDSLNVAYFVDGVQVTKGEFEQHLTPSQRKPSHSDCFTIALDNLTVF